MRLFKFDLHSRHPRRGAWLACLLLTGGLFGTANAENQPKILTDLPVTHSLVSMVMGNTSSPDLLITGSASPHNYSLRPSEAKRLDSADVLFWTSRELTPWLDRAIKKSRHPIINIELMDAPQTLRLSFRQDSKFDDGHDHGSHSHEAKSTAEDNHKQLIDPHGWLDPINGIYWLGLIADKLSELDPPNKSVYELNADAASQQLEELILDIGNRLKPVSELPFVVFHDSYHYFEERFDIHAQAAIALGDAELPGIRRMNTLKEQLSQYEGACVFTEPQFGDRTVSSLVRGLSVSTGTLDPIGANQTPGPDLYISVLQKITDELVRCLTPVAKTD